MNAIKSSIDRWKEKNDALQITVLLLEAKCDVFCGKKTLK